MLGWTWRHDNEPDRGVKWTAQDGFPKDVLTAIRNIYSNNDDLEQKSVLAVDDDGDADDDHEDDDAAQHISSDDAAEPEAEPVVDDESESRKETDDDVSDAEDAMRERQRAAKKKQKKKTTMQYVALSESELSSTVYIVFDIETTGFSKTDDSIVQLAARACLGSEVGNIDPQEACDTFNEYINTSRKSSHGAFMIHGISPDFLKDKPSFNEVAHRFNSWISSASNNGDRVVLVAHNGHCFDVPFLLTKYQQHGLSLPNNVGYYADTCAVIRYRDIATGSRDNKLMTLYEFFKFPPIDPANFHDADTDTLANVRLLFHADVFCEIIKHCLLISSSMATAAEYVAR